MRGSGLAGMAVAVLLLVLAASGCTGVAIPFAGAPDDQGGTTAGAPLRIDRVVDGDTVVLQGGDRVRLAIVDAPEAGACAAAEATAFAEAWVADHGPGIELRRPAPPLTDRFDRRLGEVIAGGRSLNVDLAAAGFGRVDERFTDEDPDLAERLRDAQQSAQRAGSGLWACGTSADRGPADPADPADPGTVPPQGILPAQPDPAQPDPAAPEGCDPAYPTLCLPPGAADLDCGDIPDRRFPVRPPDPHRFDGDGNGVGCERIETESG